jgi:hypothetical protein
MKTIRVILLVFLQFNLIGCSLRSEANQAKALVAEANNLLQQQSKIMEGWSREYGKVFAPQNRAQFPSNRDSLRSSAERLITLVDEGSKLGIAAAEKYEQASRLVKSDNERKGMALFASSFRKDVEVDDLFKAQMRLASDEKIKDEKTFNEQFRHLLQSIEQKRKESNKLLSDGKRLMGL